MAEPQITVEDVVDRIPSYGDLVEALQDDFVAMANAQISSRVGASRVKLAKVYFAAHLGELHVRALARTGEVRSETFGAESIKIDYASAQQGTALSSTSAGRVFLAIVGSSAASVGFSPGGGASC